MGKQSPVRSGWEEGHHLTFSCGLGEEDVLGLPAPPSEARSMGVGLAPAGGLGGRRLGLVFRLPVEMLLLACRVLGCVSPLRLASSLEDEKDELVERLAGTAGLSLEDTLASGASALGVLVAAGMCTVGSEELLGTEDSSVSPSTLAELSELMLSRLRAGDGVEDDGSECDSLEMGWWAAKQRESSGRNEGTARTEGKGGWHTRETAASTKSCLQMLCPSGQRGHGQCKLMQPSLHRGLAWEREPPRGCKEGKRSGRKLT